MRQFNLTTELAKIVGAHSPEILNPIQISTHPLAWRLRLKFDTKINARELLTKDIRFHNPQWGDVERFKDPILSLEFFLPIRFKVCMVGMEMYNFCIEVIGNLSGNGKSRIDKFLFYGKMPRSNTVKGWKIHKGLVLHEDHEFGKEYNDTAILGWRTGSTINHPISTLMRID